MVVNRSPSDLEQPADPSPLEQTMTPMRVARLAKGSFSQAASRCLSGRADLNHLTEALRLQEYQGQF
jgi:hypothetical protein